MLNVLETFMREEMPSERFQTAWQRYRHWYEFLQREIKFQIHSDLHGFAHCARVLFYAVILGERLNLSEIQRDTLCTAAVFHDSRRQDDGYDTGHGGQASVFYREYCTEHASAFDPIAAALMKYHDRDDDLGIERIQKHLPNQADTVLLYQAFKDSDGLDRFRLGTNGLDPRYLRTEAAKAMIGLAEKCVKQTAI